MKKLSKKEFIEKLITKKQDDKKKIYKWESKVQSKSALRW